MQIVVRKDMNVSFKQCLRVCLRQADPARSRQWPVGPLMAQASHAATAVLAKFREEESVLEYLEDLTSMRKVR